MLPYPWVSLGEIRFYDTAEQRFSAVYDAFGEELQVLDTTSDHLYRFNGKERSEVSRYHYYGYRHYDPLSMVWTQGDPLYRFAPELAYDEPRRLSLYDYSLNNPLRYVDPDGRMPLAPVDETTTGQTYNGATVPANPTQANVALAKAVAKGIEAGEPLWLAGEAAKTIVVEMVSLDEVDAMEFTSRASADGALPVGDAVGAAVVVGRRAEKAGEAVTALADTTRKLEKAELLRKNKLDGDAFRDSLADALRKEGLDVATEVRKKTPLGNRVIDIEVSKDGKVLGGIETKKGTSRYHARQRAKDTWLKQMQDYIVNVARDP